MQWIHSFERGRSVNLPCNLDYTFKETDMGKYVLAWILGVPGVVLVVAYFLFH